MLYNHLAKQLPDNPHTREFLKDFPRMAEEYVQTPIPILPYSKFRLFRVQGSRLEYENIYIDCRKRVDVLYAMIMTGHDEYLPHFQDALCAICDEHTWAFPAHIDADYTMEQEVTRIDLFAAETAFMLSEILYLLGDKLERGVCERIRYELMRRIVRPYLYKHEIWGHNNWSAVCANGVITTLIYLGLDWEFEQAKSWLLGSMQSFLDSYREDGCCREGALYWSYGFGNFVYAANLLREYTKGEIDYFKLPKVRNIAMFGFACFFHENLTIPYSDGPHRLTYNIGLYHFLKKEYPELPLPDEKYEAKFGDEKRYRYADFSRNLFRYDENLHTDGKKLSRIDYPDSQWFIRNTPTYSFSCKGGDNDEPHNHNDVGSFFVIKGDKFILEDIGWPEYDRDYFNLNFRYKNYICAMSEGHSLPIINGKGQMYGKEYCAKVLAVEENKIVLDLSGAYDIPGLKLIRTYMLDKNSVTITDNIAGAETVIERITTREQPITQDNSVSIFDCSLSNSTNTAPKISSQHFVPRLVSHIGLKELETVYLIDYPAPSNGTWSCTLTL